MEHTCTIIGCKEPGTAVVHQFVIKDCPLGDKRLVNVWACEGHRVVAIIGLAQ